MPQPSAPYPRVQRVFRQYLGTFVYKVSHQYEPYFVTTGTKTTNAAALFHETVSVLDSANARTTRNERNGTTKLGPQTIALAYNCDQVPASKGIIQTYPEPFVAHALGTITVKRNAKHFFYIEPEKPCEIVRLTHQLSQSSNVEGLLVFPSDWLPCNRLCKEQLVKAQLNFLNPAARHKLHLDKESTKRFVLQLELPPEAATPALTVFAFGHHKTAYVAAHQALAAENRRRETGAQKLSRDKQRIADLEQLLIANLWRVQPPREHPPKPSIDLLELCADINHLKTTHSEHTEALENVRQAGYLHIIGPSGETAINAKNVENCKFHTTASHPPQPDLLCL